jgi:drug/metabolite transporter (DMT)-like permease
VGLLGVFGTGVAYVLNYRSIAALGPTMASAVTYLVPVVAVVVGVVFLDERFEISLLLGGGLTVAGIALLNGRPLRRAPVSPAPASGH